MKISIRIWTAFSIALALGASMAFAREQIDLGGSGWRLWLDRQAQWKAANARIDAFIARKGWTVVLFHAVEHGFDHFPSAAVLEGHLKYVASLRDRLWVDTFGHVGLYLKERDAAKLESSLVEGGISFTLATPLDAVPGPKPVIVRWNTAAK